MKKNTSPVIDLENFKTMVLLKKLKEEDPLWLPEDELFYQRMEKSISMAIDKLPKPSSEPKKSEHFAVPLDLNKLAMSQRRF